MCCVLCRPQTHLWTKSCTMSLVLAQPLFGRVGRTPRTGPPPEGQPYAAFASWGLSRNWWTVSAGSAWAAVPGEPLDELWPYEPQCPLCSQHYCSRTLALPPHCLKEVQFSLMPQKGVEHYALLLVCSEILNWTEDETWCVKHLQFLCLGHDNQIC